MGFFKTLFGSTKKEIWQQIADDIGARFESGGFWRPDHLSYQYREWEIVLDTFTRSTGNSSTTYTRMRAPFANQDDFYFTIYRKGFFSDIAKVFGMQDIKVGDQWFDETFVIKSNKPSQIRQLLLDEDIKDLLHDQPRVHLKIKTNKGIFKQKYPKNVDELYFECVGIIKDSNRIKDLFDLFAFVLQRLVEIDSAHPDSPNVSVN
ncbi:MAG: DUF3137 domain-containing protein [Bacteroidota bacterium]